MSSIEGVRSSGLTDMTTARTLSHDNQIIDIYSNSYGPSDDGDVVRGPGRLTQMTLRKTAKEVSAICVDNTYYSICMNTFD